uniref:Uncharacterized protein n=1 Tax=Anguilla anguilla TaxID=7936 RepID=A0A0E9TGK6_ANGAN
MTISVRCFKDGVPLVSQCLTSALLQIKRKSFAIIKVYLAALSLFWHVGFRDQ